MTFQEKSVHRSHAKLWLLSATALGCLISPVTASAQSAAATKTVSAQTDAAAATLPEVVVTASRKSEALSRVPISVAAYTQERMDAQGVRNITDITRLTPGLALTPGTQDLGGTSQTISIRGISSTVGASTTGIYIDDTPIQQRSLGNASSNTFPQVFDLDRVEVLRGPQGTLFGAGAEGGAVRFITPQPSLTHFGGYARSELASTSGGALSYEAGAALGGPIVKDVLGFRASGWYRSDGGYIDRVDPFTSATVKKNANSVGSYVGRLAFKWQPVDRFTATLSVFAQQIKADDASSFFVALSNPGNSRFANPRVVPDTSKDRFTLPSLNLQYDGSGFSAISTTSYFARNVDRTVDYTDYISALLLGGPGRYAPGEYSSAEVDDSQRDFTQELRLQSNGSGPFTWVVGAFYSQSKQTAFQHNLDPFLNTALARLGRGPFPLLNGNSLFDTHARSEDTQTAAFAQVDYRVFDKLKLTAGLRYAKVDLSAARVSTGPVAGAGGVNFSTGRSETPVTPKFGLSYQADPNALLYATVAKGYRIGGVNGPQNSLCASALASIGLSSSPATYQSDHVWSYEGGAKVNLANGRLRVDASAFDIEWKNIQQNITLSSCGSGFVTNLGSARSTGFDLSVDFRPIDNLTLGATVGYANARLTSTTLGTNVSYGNNGDKIGGPPWTWTLSAEYSLPVGDQDSAYLRSDYQHVGAGPTKDYSVFGVDPLVPPSQAYDQLSLRLGVRRERLDLSVFVNNLLDQAPRLSLVRYPSTFLTNFQETTLRPRTIGVTLSDHF